MRRSLPVLALVVLVVLAGCLGSFGFDSSGESTTQPVTSTPTSTQAATPTATTQPSTTTSSTTTRTTTTWTHTTTTAHIDTPANSSRFRARVIDVSNATTITIEHDGRKWTVDLVGVTVPNNTTNADPSQYEGVPSSKQGKQLLGKMQTRALRLTKSQLDHQVVTVATDPMVEQTDGHRQVYVYTGNFMYNTELLRTGYGRVADSNFSMRSRFVQKQQQAQQNGYELWRNGTT